MTRTRHTPTTQQMADGRPTARERGVVAREGGASAEQGSSSARGGEGVAANYDSLISLALQKVEVKNSVIARGVSIYEKGGVVDSPLYPWIFTVIGEGKGQGARARGNSVYSINLTLPSCSCRYHQMTQTMCKHIVAATARYQHRKGTD